jgi:mediator of RNA polymerase II transcription subunit 5
MLIMNYLQTKYKVNLQVDVETLAIDLVVGAFDILSSAVSRKENDQTIFALKSFLINKIPLLLTNLSATMYSSERPEYCLAQALSRVDNVVFPPPSFGMMSDNTLQDVRQEFLFSCTLHSILRSSSIEALLGEQPTFSQPPDPSARYIKETLMEQANSDPDKITQLIEQLDKLNGNAGAISWAIVEVCYINFFYFELI